MDLDFINKCMNNSEIREDRRRKLRIRRQAETKSRERSESGTEDQSSNTDHRIPLISIRLQPWLKVEGIFRCPPDSIDCEGILVEITIDIALCLREVELAAGNTRGTPGQDCQ